MRTTSPWWWRCDLVRATFDTLYILYLMSEPNRTVRMDRQRDKSDTNGHHRPSQMAMCAGPCAVARGPGVTPCVTHNVPWSPTPTVSAQQAASSIRKIELFQNSVIHVSKFAEVRSFSRPHRRRRPARARAVHGARVRDALDRGRVRAVR